ncbi:MAG: DUF4365 domain-containing protein [Acidobacteriota bacterium]|nr:DUF4365 domain-containing protein [Acidobacteriota bacterium]
MTDADQKEALSRVYALAVAARAGCTTAYPDFDRDGVDLVIQSGMAMRPAIGVQLKATSQHLAEDDSYLRFRLKRRNYDLLREETQTPRVLVVLQLPADREQWLTITEDDLVLRYRAYWLSLRGSEDTTNSTSVTVSIPKANLFNVESLDLLLERSMRGTLE